MSILNNELKPPESRGEKTLHDMVGGDYPLEPSQSRVESLLIALKNAIEQGSGGSGLPDVNNADNGKVLKVENGAWGMGNNIHWLEGGSTYLPYTQTFLTAVMDAIPIMLQNNYMSYTVAMNFNETVAENVQSMAQEIFMAFGSNETPIYRANGITGFNDIICPLKYVSFDPAAPVSNFDLLVNGYIYYTVSGGGPFAANIDLSITRRAGTATGMFVKLDRLVDGAHS